jgi:hypothetical protein
MESDDIRLALKLFVEHHGLSKRWLAEKDPLAEKIRQLTPWFPTATQDIYRHAECIAENRRRIAKLRQSAFGRLILRLLWPSASDYD